MGQTEGRTEDTSERGEVKQRARKMRKRATFEAKVTDQIKDHLLSDGKKAKRIHTIG